MVNKENILVVSTVASEFEDNMTQVSVVRSIDSFERYVKETPHIVDNLIIDTTAVPFNNDNLIKVKTVCNNPFLIVRNKVIYVVTKAQNKEEVLTVLESILDDYKVAVEQLNEIDEQLLKQIIRGKYTNSEVEVIDTAIVELSIQEYLSNKDNLEKLVFDNIPKIDNVSVDDIVEPIAETVGLKEIIDVVGVDNYAIASAILWLIWNQRSDNKIYVQEYDFEYQYLTDFFMTNKISVDYIYYNKLIDNHQNIKKLNGKVNSILSDRKNSNSVYESLFNYVYSITSFDKYIRVTKFKRLNSGNDIYITFRCSAPEILKLISILGDDMDFTKITFIGVRTNELNEMSKNDVRYLLESMVNSKIKLIIISTFKE